MIKILHISITSDIGGGPEHIYQLISGLSENIESHIACPINGPYFKKFSKLINGRHTTLTNRKFKIYDFIKIFQYTKKNKINIIHSHGKGAGVYGKLLKLFLNVILIHTPHGINQINKNSISNRFFLLFENFLKKLNNCIVFVSPSELQYASKKNLWRNCKSVIIYNGTKCFSKAELQYLKYSERKISNKNSKVIITASRFDYQKNTIEFCMIAQKLPQYNFVILGDGLEKENCMKYCELKKIENVQFKGFINNTISFLTSADLYLSTARWEGLSMSILEAMSIGLPIIATNVIGNKDIVFQNKNGFLYDLGDLNEAVKFIKYVLDEDNYFKFSSESILIHENSFSSNYMCKETESLYKLFLP